MTTTTPSKTLAPEARNHLVGMLLTGVGAILLLVSLFLDWFEPGLSAWTVFEVWDLVLAALALMALVAVASRLQFGTPRPDSWLLIPALVTPVVVVAALLNHPPAAQGTGQDPIIGIWLALAGSLLMALGAVAAIARISVALDRPGSAVATRQPGAAVPQASAGVSPQAPGVPPAAPPQGSPVAPKDPALGDEPPTRPTRPI
jgi:hypothetical protein